MNGWMIKNPLVFFGVAGAVVAYVLYMMIRKRKGERTATSSEVDL